MTSKIFLRLALILFIVGVFTATLAAQSVELYPYAGGFWPTGMDGMGNSKLKSEGIYGLKAGVFVTPNAEIEGSFGYINHFGMRNSPMDLTPNGIATPMGGFSSTAMGFLYDINGAWNFGKRQFLNTRFSPYISAGVGGLTTEIRHGAATVIQGAGPAGFDANGNIIPNTAPAHMLRDGDTFFTVNYGGGVKAMNVWGPVGFRADVRGRTIPNFFHESPSWPELTGGLLFSWGER